MYRLNFLKQNITVIIVLFERNNGFYAVVAISMNFLWNCNYNIEVQKTITFQKGMDLKIWEYPYGM